MADEDEERQRFSPDSSTHVLSKEKRKHRKKKKHKHKSKKRKRKHSVERASSHGDQLSDSTNNSTAPSEDDECQEANQKGNDEFVIDIKPLTEYIDDRKELNNELFKILGRKEMKKMMQKSVKKLDAEDLKSRCLDQLEIISKKRLLSIIKGEEMNSSSSESEHESTNVADVLQENPIMEASQSVADTQEDESMNIMKELSVGPDQDEIDELIEGPANKARVDAGQDNPESADQDNPEHIGNNDPKSAKESPEKDPEDTESQFLELQYRARALKSLMQARQTLDT